MNPTGTVGVVLGEGHSEGRRTVRRNVWWMRPIGAAAIIGVLVWQLGTGPFRDALRGLDGWSVAAAAGIGLLTTLCCAWRWRLVARGLGVALPLGAAVAGYYRSQFLNATLPGGVLGDVQRGLRHGRDVGDLGRGVRSVVWDRCCGQVVQVGVAATVLVLLPSPVHPPLTTVLAAGAGAVLVAATLCASLHRRAAPGPRPSILSRGMRTAAGDLRPGILARRTWPGIVLASALAVAGHAAMFVIAARSAGSVASPQQLLPLALLVLLAMGLPLNVAGWGPREGVAAWVFGAAGLGVEQGVATAVVYGVMVLVASLPGAGLLLAARLGHRALGAARA